MDKNQNFLMEINDFENFPHFPELIGEELDASISSKLKNSAIINNLVKVESIYLNYSWFIQSDGKFFMISFMEDKISCLSIKKFFLKLSTAFEVLKFDF